MGRHLSFAAALPVLALACSFPRPANIDPTDSALGSDSNPGAGDAAMGPDASPGLVQVTVMDPKGSGQPAAGVPVVFIDPDGTVVANVATDSNGKAMAEMLPGGNVTAVFDGIDMETVFGVKPGDDLVIAKSNDVTTTGTYTVTFPPYSGATLYYVWGPCGAAAVTTTTATLTIHRWCSDPKTVYVDAYNNTNSYVGYIEKGNVTLSPGGTINIGGTWPPYMTMTSHLINIPPDVKDAYASRSATTSHYAAVAVAGGVPTSGMLTMNANVPPSTLAVVETQVHKTGGPSQQAQIIHELISGTSASYTLDVGAQILPWVDSPLLDVATGEVTTPVVGATAGDFFRGSVGYYRTIGGTTKTFTWTFFAADPSSVVLPKLPLTLGDVNPKTGDVVNYGDAEVIDFDNIAGYDTARDHMFELFTANHNGRSPVGTLRMSRSEMAYSH